uniref:SpoVT-AbrB domain-containing protein n=2 Tax=Candidatus Bipolaricaulota TaxID=67810 RepID=H5SA07_9BACT|nr:hypothetical protein HGMM_F04A11C11 [uncultured Acetothermia bacterium]BAL60165.1 hypothetical protein HGMM_OP4C801 [Candidatus Acetothermum autotrophicum]
MAIVRVRPRRQVTIPKEIFDRLGLHEGDFVEVRCNKDKIVLEPVDPDDVLTPEEEALVRLGEEQLRRGEYVLWEDVKKKLRI